MEVRILKGANQIGGCVTEITSSKGTKIIIDFGEDLDDEEKKKIPDIKGLTKGEPKYKAVFITHSHGDHIGLINYILDTIPVYVEPISKEIYRLTSTFTSKKSRYDTIDMEFEKEILIDDIKVTPFFVDHSAYNASMLLIEGDGQRILHTGDYRNHGLKGDRFEETLKKIGKVNMVITEGTTLTRETKKYDTEEDIKNKAISLFQEYDQIFILQSSTNIDRIKSFYEAAKMTNKNFIEDIFTANITKSLNDETVPVPGKEKDVYVWVPCKYKRKKDEFKKDYIYPFLDYKKQSSYRDMKYCFMVKNSMAEDIGKLYKKGFISNPCLIYSMWEGYKEKSEMQEFFEEIKEYGLTEDRIKYLHTSGHASIEAFKMLNDYLKPEEIRIIHTDNQEKAYEVAKEIYGDKVKITFDKEEIEIGKKK